jgi:hypothetical protein
MDSAIIIAAVVAYFVAYAVLALGEGLREYFKDIIREDGLASRIAPGQRTGPGHAPGPR